MRTALSCLIASVLAVLSPGPGAYEALAGTFGEPVRIEVLPANASAVGGPGTTDSPQFTEGAGAVGLTSAQVRPEELVPAPDAAVHSVLSAIAPAPVAAGHAAIAGQTPLEAAPLTTAGQTPISHTPLVAGKDGSASNPDDSASDRPQAPVRDSAEETAQQIKDLGEQGGALPAYDGGIVQKAAPVVELPVIPDGLQTEVDAAQAVWTRYRQEFGRAVFGQEQMRDSMLLGFIADGHVLLEGNPGTAKTWAALAVAQMFGLNFQRIQFTPETQPTDITGQDERDKQTGEWAPNKGPVFANIVLADEINRTPPKTQAALLQAMQEKKVTIGKQTYALDDPNWVIATQNPIEQEGTWPLPEAQLDRFMLKVVLPSMDEAGYRGVLDINQKIQVDRIIEKEDAQRLRALAKRIVVAPNVKDYIAKLVAATVPGGPYQKVNDFVRVQASPRAAVRLLEAAQAQALLSGRAYVTAKDVKDVAVRVLAHRLVLRFEARTAHVSAEQIIESLIARKGGVPVNMIEEAAEDEAPQAATAPPAPAQAPGVSLFSKLHSAFHATVTSLVLIVAAAAFSPVVPLTDKAVPIRLLMETPYLHWLALGLAWLSGPVTATLGLMALVGIAFAAKGSRLTWRKAALAALVVLPLSLLVAPWLGIMGAFLAPGPNGAAPLGANGIPASAGFWANSAVLAQTLGEEVVFRAGLFNALFSYLRTKYKREGSAFLSSALISSTVFMLAHVLARGFIPAAMIGWMVGGMIFSYLYWISGRKLAAPAAAHLFYDLLVMGLLPFWSLPVAALGLIAWGKRLAGDSLKKSLKGFSSRLGAWLGIATQALIIPLATTHTILGAWHVRGWPWYGSLTMSVAVALAALLAEYLVYFLMSGLPRPLWPRKGQTPKRYYNAYPLLTKPLE